ncbi:MAG: glycosyltransferase [Proteobacteria bacterium]|nr:glycosyltransferase [Pseudomonadota bacterium]
MSNPLISVIIPTHNRRERIIRAVDSVLDQTFSDFELIVVDDCSTDGTVDVLTARSDQRLILLEQEHRGVSAARNNGVGHSKGTYIAFLDSDDLWHKDKLRHQIDFHQKNPHFKISQTQEIWIRHGKRVNPKKKHKKSDGYIFPPSLHLCTISPSSVFMTKSLYEEHGGFDENMSVCEDYDLWLRISAGNEVGLLDEILLTKYGGHEDQLSRNYPAIDRFRIYSLFKVLLSGSLNECQQHQAREVCEMKLNVLLLGAEKRGQDTSELKDLARDVFNRNLTSGQYAQRGTSLLLDERLYRHD